MTNRPFGPGDRVRVRPLKSDTGPARYGVILTCSLIHGDHYHVRMDEGYETLLVAAEIEHADAAPKDPAP